MRNPQSHESSWTEDDTVDTDKESEQLDPRSLARRLFAQYPSLQGTREPGTDSPTSNETPQTIAGYRVKKHIGRGAFGNVYLCQEQHPPHRELAIKVIRAGMDTSDVLARFEAEKNALSMMNHPAIARILDAGATEDGNPYFAMEYVEGVPLTEFCSRNRLTLEERLRLFIEICQGVQHAHNKAVVHRDLKPSNIMVTEVDGVTQAKIIDFGLVKSLQQPLRDQSIHTQYGVALGTFEYMSPEQVKSGGIHIDTRSDIYALGAILYELLTGEFAFPDLRKHGYAELLRTITRVDAVRPSQRIRSGDATRTRQHAATMQSDLNSLSRSLATDLDWVVMKAMEKDPERRYQACQEMANDIERYLSGELIEARPPSATYRFKKTVCRHRGLLTSTALVFVALIAGMTWALMAEQKERKRAQELETMVQFQEQQFSDIDVPGMGVGLRRQLIDRSMAVVEKSGLAENELEQRRKELEQALLIDWTEVSKETIKQYIFEPALESIGEQFESQPLLRARLLQTVATTLDGLGLYEMATQPQEQTLSIRREALGNDHPTTLSSINNMGNLLRHQCKYDEAKPFFREAIKGKRRVLGDDHPETLISINIMGLLLREMGKLNEAEVFSSEALKGRRRILGDEHPDTLTSINSMGALLYTRGKLDEAEPFIREALEGNRRVLGDDHRNTLWSINVMGVLLNRQGKLDEAEPFYREVLEGRRRIFGNDHPLTLQSIANMGALLTRWGKLDEAEPFTREALEGKRRVLGDDHSSTLRSISNMGSLFRSRDKLDEAEPFYREALEGRRRVLGDDHPDTLWSINNMGILLKRQDKLDEAEPFYREALEGRRRVLGDDHPHTLSSIRNMGYLLKEQGKFDEAEPFYRKALEGRRRVLGDDHPHTLSSIRNMGYLLKEQGKFDEAEILSNEALEGYRRIHGDEIVDTRTTTNSSEVILRLLGRRGEAQTIAAERGSRLIFGDDHPYTLSSIANMGFLLNRQGKLDEAEPFFREALEGRRRVLGDDHPDTLNSINNMGRLLRNLGRPEEAQALGAEAVERARRVLPAELSYLGIYLTNHSRTLVAMKRFDEAKPHALEGHAIFEANFGSSHKRTIDALQGLVGLYQAWNMADPNSGHDLAAIRWQAQLDAITSSPLTAVFQQ